MKLYLWIWFQQIFRIKLMISHYCQRCEENGGGFYVWKQIHWAPKPNQNSSIYKKSIQIHLIKLIIYWHFVCKSKQYHRLSSNAFLFLWKFSISSDLTWISIPKNLNFYQRRKNQHLMWSLPSDENTNLHSDDNRVLSLLSLYWFYQNAVIPLGFFASSVLNTVICVSRFSHSTGHKNFKIVTAFRIYFTTFVAHRRS